MRMGLFLGLGMRRGRSGPSTGPSVTAPGSLDVSTFKIGTEHTITEGTATATGGGTVTYEYRWLVGGVSDATTAAYTPQAADDEATIAAQWRGVETGGTNDGETNWQTVGSGTITYNAPVAANALVDQLFAQNDGVQTYDASGDFTVSGDASLAGVTFSVNAVTGVTINSGTGIVSFDTDAMAEQTGTSIVVTATNSGGNDTSGFSLEIDGTLPVVNAFSVAQPASTIEFTIDVDEGESSYFAYIVGVTAGETAPSVAQTIAGQNNAGGNAEFWVDGYEFSSDLTDQAITLDRETELNGNIDWYLVVQDPAENNSTQASDLGVAIDTTVASGALLTAEAGWPQVQGSSRNSSDRTFASVALTAGEYVITMASTSVLADTGGTFTAAWGGTSLSLEADTLSAGNAGEKVFAWRLTVASDATNDLVFSVAGTSWVTVAAYIWKADAAADLTTLAFAEAYTTTLTSISEGHNVADGDFLVGAYAGNIEAADTDTLTVTNATNDGEEQVIVGSNDRRHLFFSHDCTATESPRTITVGTLTSAPRGATAIGILKVSPA